MHRLKSLCVVLLAIAAVGVATAAAANAELPKLLFLSGVETGVLKSTSAGKGEMGSIFGSIKFGGSSLLLAGSEMLSSGAADVHLTEVSLGESECHTEGDASNVVLFPLSNTEWHAVLNSEGKLLLLISIKELTIKCGSVSFKARGGWLSSLEPFGKEVLESETFSAASLCNKEGTPEFTAYTNDNGEAVTVKLELNAGLGWQKTCMSIEGTIKLQPSQMVEIM